MAEFNYSKYVADMAQRTGPMFENNDANQLDNAYLDQLDLTTKLAETDDLKEYEVIYVVQNGNCYRITDEGYKDQVSMEYCRRYAESVNEDDMSDETEDLKEYEVIYVVENGKCYRITDEGYKDQVDMSKCRMYAEAIEDTDVETSEDEFNSAEFDKEPSKKDIKAAEKEFSLEVPKADASADSAFEKAKQIIKIKVGKLLSQPKGKRTASPDMAALKQFIQKPEIKKAFKSRGLDVMDFVKDVIA